MKHADFIGWDLNFTDTFKEISSVHFGIKETGNSCITGDGKVLIIKQERTDGSKDKTQIFRGGGGEAAETGLNAH
jgi:hypothetical protein